MMITISKGNYLKDLAQAEAEDNTAISALLAHWLSVTPPAKAAATVPVSISRKVFDIKTLGQRRPRSVPCDGNAHAVERT
jgi:hypothetical protein